MLQPAAAAAERRSKFKEAQPVMQQSLDSLTLSSYASDNKRYSCLSNGNKPRSLRGKDRFCDDMELEFQFGPGIVDRLKSKFTSASSASYTIQEAHSSKNPISVSSSSAPRNMNTRNSKLDGILSHDTMANKVIVVDRTNGVYPPQPNTTPPPSKLAPANNYNTLIDKSECIEGLVSQYKAIFDKDWVPPRRKRAKDPLNPSPPPVGSSPPKIPSPGNSISGHPFRKSQDVTNTVEGLVVPLKDSHIDVSPLAGLSYFVSPPSGINSALKSKSDDKSQIVSANLSDSVRSVSDSKLIMRSTSADQKSVLCSPEVVAVVATMTPALKSPAPPPRPKPPLTNCTPQPPPRPTRKAYLQLTGNTGSAKPSLLSRFPGEAVVLDTPAQKPEVKDFKRNHADSTQDSPEMPRNDAVKAVVISPTENTKPVRPEKVQKMSENAATESEKENNPRRVTLKKISGYGMTTIIDTKSKPIEPVTSALKIDDPALLTSLKDLGRTRPLQSHNGSDAPDGILEFETETLNLIVLGHNSRTGSKSNLKSPENQNNKARANLRISFDDRATKTYEYPSERSFSLDIIVLSVDDENESNETDTDTVGNSQREGDFLKKLPGKLGSANSVNGFGSSFKTSLTNNFQLGVERPAFPEISQAAAPSNDSPQPRVQRREQWCIQPTEEESFSNTTSDADDLLF